MTRKQRISSRVSSMPPSGIREFFDIAATMTDVVSLSVGEPDMPTPQHVRDAAHRSIEESTAYTSNQGLFELRQAVADLLERLYGLRYDPVTEILITVGVSEGLQGITLGTLDAGDEVIMADPYYVAYIGSVMTANATAVYVPTSAADGFEVTAEAIEAAITPRTKAIMIGNPGNPTGAVISYERLCQIAELAERYDLLVYADEIYDRLVYNGTKHTCFASLPGARDRTVILGGVSKAYSMTGWRIGWIAAPEDLTAVAGQIHQYSILSAPTMGQHAALQAVLHGEADVARMVDEYDRRRRFLLDGLNALGLPTIEPRGAFYAFPYTGHLNVSSREFAKALLLEAGVAIIPGSAFGSCGEGFQRVCYASTSIDTLARALERIEHFLRKRGWLHAAAVQSGDPHNVWKVGQFAAEPQR